MPLRDRRPARRTERRTGRPSPQGDGDEIVHGDGHRPFVAVPDAGGRRGELGDRLHCSADGMREDNRPGHLNTGTPCNSLTMRLLLRSRNSAMRMASAVERLVITLT